MGLRDAMRKAAGLLVQLPPEGDNENRGPAGVDGTQEEIDRILAGNAPSENAGEAKTVAQIVREGEGPNLEEIRIEDAPVSSEPGAPMDFQAIYNAAKLPASPFSAEQMLEMLQSLPSELPLDTKRQTVKVTLASLGKTMGASPETIVSDASRKLTALNAYIEHLTRRVDEFTAVEEKQIAEMQTKIEEKRKGIQDAKYQLTQSSHACDAESEQLDEVLEFFSLDVAPSKYAEPSTPPPVVHQTS